MTEQTIPFAIGGLDHVVLRVRDMERAIAFYRDVLGAAEERRVESIGLVQMRAGRSLIDLVPLPEGAATATGNMEHFAITIAPFDPEQIAAHLARHGIEAAPPAERYGAEGSGPSIYIDDPDGNTVELKGPAASPRIAG
jgi:catechol 2,3-dioxygenase-like lactoylglutathione lyase family enzyme